MVALRSGDASAVNEMYRILLPFAKRFAPPSYNLKRQLQAEYGVSAEDGELYTLKITREEMEEALELLA